MQTRERIHQLIDETPDSELAAIERFLTDRRAAPFLDAFANAPLDDEPMTPEDEAALAEACAEVAAGRLITHEEDRRRCEERTAS